MIETTHNVPAKNVTTAQRDDQLPITDFLGPMQDFRILFGNDR